MPTKTAAAAALLAVLAGLVFYRGAYGASNLESGPDAVEYAVGAKRLAAAGRYDLPIEGRYLPPRYPPWFSAVLAPAYLASRDLGAGVHLVWLCAVAGVLAAFLIGLSLGSAWGGALAGASLILLPSYRFWSGMIMTEAPACAAALAACALYLRMGDSASEFLLAGVLAAFSAALRPATLVLLLPFLISLRSTREGRFLRLALLLLPAGALGAGTAAYNLSTFGSIFRNGYKFWCPVPYDYVGLTFSPDYLPKNLLETLLGSGLPLTGAAALWLLGKLGRDLPRAKRAAGFIVLGTGPLVLLHLVYFHSAPRFLLAPTALTLVLAAALAGRRLPEAALVPVLAAAVAAAGVWRAGRTAERPGARAHADFLAQALPPDSVVLTNFDPVYLKAFLSGRRVVPLSRRVEHASKLVAWKKVPQPDPPPAGPYDHRCAGLKAGGAGEAVAFVAEERMDDLQALAGLGLPLFFDAAGLSAGDAGPASLLSDRFAVEPAGEDLYRLKASPRASGRPGR